MPHFITIFLFFKFTLPQHLANRTIREDEPSLCAEFLSIQTRKPSVDTIIVHLDPFLAKCINHDGFKKITFNVLKVWISKYREIIALRTENRFSKVTISSKRIKPRDYLPIMSVLRLLTLCFDLDSFHLVLWNWVYIDDKCLAVKCGKGYLSVNLGHL